MDNKGTDYIIKNSKKREKELKYDFMPSMIEIIEKPANRAGTLVIWGVLSLFVVAFVWAALARLDITVRAGATILPEGNMNILKAYHAGVVKSINVTEGQFVEEGDVLIEFDQQLTEVNEAQLLSQKSRLNAEKQVYEALLDNRYEAIALENYAEEIRPYIGAILETYNGYRNKNDILRKQADAQGVSKAMAELQLKKYEEIGAGDEMERTRLLIRQYELAQEEAELNINANSIALQAQLNEKLAECISGLEETKSQLMQYQVSKEYQTLIASTSGYVNSVNVSRVGENVAAGQELVSIVPKDAKLEIVAYVADGDISDIRIGMESQLRLKAYSYHQYGTVGAKVKYISPAAFSDKNTGNRYLVRLEITHIPRGVDILTGMQGELEFKMGNRSVLDYILDPIKKGMGESLKEK